MISSKTIDRVVALVLMLCLLSLSGLAQSGGLADLDSESFTRALNMLNNSSKTDVDKLEDIEILLKQAGTYQKGVEYLTFVESLLLLQGVDEDRFDRAYDSMQRLSKNKDFTLDYYSQLDKANKQALPDLEKLLQYINARKLEANGDREPAIALYDAYPVLDAVTRAGELTNTIRKEKFERAMALLSEGSLSSVQQAEGLLRELGNYRNSAQRLKECEMLIAELTTPIPTPKPTPVPTPTKAPIPLLVPSLAEPVMDPVSFNISWTAADTTPRTQTAVPVAYPGYEGSYWLFAEPEALAAQAVLTISDNFSQYPGGFSIPSGEPLSNLMFQDAGNSLLQVAVPVYAYDADKNIIATYQLYVSASAPEPAAPDVPLPTDVPTTQEPTKVPTATVSVRYVDAATGLDVASPQQQAGLQPGQYSIPAAPADLQPNYNPAGPSEQTLTVDASGIPNPAYITFTYTYVEPVTEVPVTEAPIPDATINLYYRDPAGLEVAPKVALVPVLYKDQFGSVLFQSTESIREGTPTTINVDLASLTDPDNYTLNDAPQKTVIVDAQGLATPSEVVFLFTNISSVTVNVYYVAETGETVVQPGQQALKLGVNDIIPNPVGLPGDYQLVSPGLQQVVLEADGTLSPVDITFLYRKAEPAITEAPAATEFPYSVTPLDAYAYPRGDAIRFRYAPRIEDNNILTSLNQLNLVKLTGELTNDLKEKWYLGEFDGMNGFISANFVRVLTQQQVDELFGYTAAPTAELTSVLQPPASIYTSIAQESIAIHWTLPNGAQKCNVYRADSMNGSLVLIATVIGKEYRDTAVTAGETYYYRLSSVKEYRESNLSIQYEVNVPKPAPKPTVKPTPTKKPTPAPSPMPIVLEDLPNGFGNSTNGNLAVVYDGIIYYENGNDFYSIYSAKLDGNNPKRLFRTSAYPNSGLCVVDGWIYHINSSKLVKTSITGKSSKVLLKDTKMTGYAGDILVHQGRVYIEGSPYNEDSSAKDNLYSIKTDGSDYKLIPEVTAWEICAYDDYLFYVETFTQGVFRIGLDGKSKQKLYNGSACSLNITRDWVFFASQGSILRMRHDGSGLQKVFDVSTDYFNISGSHIYYPTSNSIRRVSLDGTNDVEILSNVIVFDLCIAGDWIFAYQHDYHDNMYEVMGMYKLRKDGTGLQKVLPVNDPTIK